MCKMLFKRCCYFVPPKIGILIWAYINMLGLLAPIGLYGFISFIIIAFYGLGSEIAKSLEVFLMLSLELAFIVLLIVAAHKENITLHQIFFYYSLISTPIQTVLLILYIRCCDEYYNPDNVTVITITVIIYAVLKLYMTIIIKIEINKLKNKYKIGSEDYDNDAQCAIDMTQDKERFEKGLRVEM